MKVGKMGFSSLLCGNVASAVQTPEVGGHSGSVPLLKDTSESASGALLTLVVGAFREAVPCRTGSPLASL